MFQSMWKKNTYLQGCVNKWNETGSSEGEIEEYHAEATVQDGAEGVAGEGAWKEGYNFLTLN